MAERLGVSRDTVTRDLEEIDRAAAEDLPPADPSGRAAGDSAPPAEAAAGEVAEDLPPAEEVAAAVVRPAETPPPALPRRASQAELVIDLDGWPALRRDLAVLAATGRSAEALINQAVVCLAYGYRQGVRLGQIRPDRPFTVQAVTVGQPGHAVPRAPVPEPPPKAT